MERYKNTSMQMMEFIEKSPSVYHVIFNIERMLCEQSFIRLEENEPWRLEFGHKYYVIRNDSSIIAFSIGQKGEYGFRIVASHSDSPSFKLKNNPEMVIENNYLTLNTEKYGGMIMSSWMDRPLSVAGRVVADAGESLCTKLVNIDRDILIIPNQAIHMNREMNKGYNFNPQKDMLPLFGQAEDKGSIKRLVAEYAGVSEKNILGEDLFLYNRMKGRIWGAMDEYISSPRLDDLQCAYASVNAFLQNNKTTGINMCCVFDNEEVGSRTAQGADSDFLACTMERIYNALGYEREEYLIAAGSSFMISADNAHGVHPNHPETADPTNRPYLNGGIVIKCNANQRYTTDAYSQARMISICKKAGVPYQLYANRSDIEGGSTLGNISVSHVSLHTVDIGLAQLAMHSAYETGGVKDTEYLIQALKVFWE